jgi:hypothetical protein
VGSHSHIGRIALGTAVLIGLASGLDPARAHFVLVTPDSWMSQGAVGDPQKLGPCGEEGGGTPTGKVTAFRPGQTIEVTVDEKIFHPGHYRVALAVDDRSELPPPPVVTAVGSDPCGSAEIQDPPTFPILADNMLPHMEPFDAPQTFTVTLPSDVTCGGCTLQVIEYMSRHGRPCFYHHCANISIQADPATPTATPTPIDGPPTPTATHTSMAVATSTATPPPPARCVGDCDDSGTVTINEIVTLVGIALERSPIGLCAAGNADGNQTITINEILTAVNRALSGCTSRVSAVHPVTTFFPAAHPLLASGRA